MGPSPPRPAAASDRLLWLLLAGSAVLRVWFSSILPLSGDEAYHWMWSQHLAGSYYDHPGMTGWLIWLAECLLPAGSGELAVRLPAVVCLTLAAWICARLAREVAVAEGAPPAAAAAASLTAAGLVVFTPVYAVLAVYMSTDPPLLLFWVAALWQLHRVVVRGAGRDWVGFGLGLGLAANSKLLALLLLPIAALTLLGRGSRQRLRGPGPWLGVGTALLASTPVLAWNAANRWMTFQFNFVIRQEDPSGGWYQPLVYVGSQVGAVSPFLLALVVAWLIRRPSSASQRLLWVAALVPLAAFLLVSFRRRVGLHWPAPAWLPALAALAVAFATDVAWTQRAWSRRLWRLGWGFCVALVAAAHLLGVWIEPLARLELVRGQPARVMKQLIGWHEFGAELRRMVEEMRTGSAPGVFVMANQYGLAAAVTFYSGERTLLCCPERRHGRNFAYWDDWQRLRACDALFVAKRRPPEFELDALRRRFAAVSAPHQMVFHVAGGRERSFWVWTCRGFDGEPPYPTSMR